MPRELVSRRAGGRCEYCRAEQDVCAYTFHLEHIVPRARGGTDHSDNRAFSCWPCNSAKASHVTGLDPQTGKEAPLYHPRRHAWLDHFFLSPDFLRIVGKSPTGRATVERLRMNDPRFQPKARRLWMAAGRWP